MAPAAPLFQGADEVIRGQFEHWARECSAQPRALVSDDHALGREAGRFGARIIPVAEFESLLF